VKKLRFEFSEIFRTSFCEKKLFLKCLIIKEAEVAPLEAPEMLVEEEAMAEMIISQENLI